jgi:hypothetical protein
LNWRTSGLEEGRKHGGQTRIEGFDAQGGQGAVLRLAARWEPDEEPESARIHKSQLARTVEMQHEVGVEEPGSLGRLEHESSRHPEVDQSVAAVVEIHDEVLAPPAEAGQSATRESPFEQREVQVAPHGDAPASHALDECVADVVFQDAADGLHFGQLGHARIIPQMGPPDEV